MDKHQKLYYRHFESVDFARDGIAEDDDENGNGVDEDCGADLGVETAAGDGGDEDGEVLHVDAESDS